MISIIKVLKAKLKNVSGKKCSEIPKEEFEIYTRKARYIYFKPVRFYGLAAGLRSLSWQTGEEFGTNSLSKVI